MDKLPSFYPGMEKGDRMWIYVIGRPNAEVKVGITRNPRGRLDGHRWVGGIHWCHLAGSGQSRTIREAEKAAIRRLAAAGARVGRHAEVFAGITREFAVLAVRESLAEQRLVTRKAA